MSRPFRIALIPFLFPLAAAFAAPDAKPSLLDDPEVAPAIRIFESWLETQMAYRALPGVAVGLVYDQDLVWAKGFGYADTENKTPVTPTTLFRMASNTKVFTTTLIMQLRDEGKLRLDDPVSKYLPWFQLKRADADDAAPVTVAHLLMHGSGLPREFAAPYWNTFQFPSRDDIRKGVSAQTAAFPPDQRWKYSNLALSLAGMIAEEITGERYAGLVSKRIFEPLGMSASSIDKDVPGLATGYGRRMPDGSRMKMPFTDTRGIGPAAGLTSNVEDLAKFISLQFRHGPAGGKQILAGGSLREMQRVHFLENDWTHGTGLGFQVRRVKEKIYDGHGGSLAGYKTQTLFCADDKVGVIVLSNGDDSRPSQIADRAMSIIGSAVAKAAKPEKKPEWDPKWTRFAGLYRSFWGDIQVVALKDKLVMFDPEDSNPAEDMEELVPRPDGSFTLEAKTGGDSIGEAVRFIEEGGRVKSVQVGADLSERVR